MANYLGRKHVEPKTPIGTVAELFAGVGGFRIGLARSGWKTVYSNQWEPSTRRQHASEVYEARFGAEGHSNQDIASVESLPFSVDMLVGGFPCQDYSVAKSSSSAVGLEGKKGVLWWEIQRLVAQHAPNFVFLENVDRLLKSPSSQRGRDFAVMLKTLANPLEDLGYGVEWRVVTASEYGAPQRRSRVFIVARKLETLAKISEPRDVILKSGVLARAFPVFQTDATLQQIDLSKPVEEISDTFSLSAKKSPFQNAGWFLGDTAYTLKVEPEHRGKHLTLGDVLLEDSQVPDEFRISEDELGRWEGHKRGKTVQRTHKETGFQYKYAEGSMAFPDLLTNPSRTILTAEGGKTPSRFKHIIKTESGHRRLTPIELERLNGFPDGWTETGTDGAQISDARRAFFMGNALVIDMVDRVGRVLAEEQKLLNLSQPD